MNKQAFYRQGDILIIPVEDIPDTATPVKLDAGRAVLAYGEVTGHAHAIVEPVRFVEISQLERYIEAHAAFRVQHEEHATVDVPAGKYRVVRQREYTPEAIRVVAD